LTARALAARSEFPDSPLEEEIVDLAFLAEELLGSSKQSQGDSCASQIAKKIRSRKPTVKLNSGKLNYQDEKGSSSGPWELTCLNHHAVLKVNFGIDDADIEQYKKDCFEFLYSDYTFMPYWGGRESLYLEGGALKRFDVGSIVCSTLLDIKSKYHHSGQNKRHTKKIPFYSIESGDCFTYSFSGMQSGRCAAISV
jgi:hypothetical protein